MPYVGVFISKKKIDSSVEPAESTAVDGNLHVEKLNFEHHVLTEGVNRLRFIYLYTLHKRILNSRQKTVRERYKSKSATFFAHAHLYFFFFYGFFDLEKTIKKKNRHDLLQHLLAIEHTALKEAEEKCEERLGAIDAELTQTLKSHE